MNNCDYMLLQIAKNHIMSALYYVEETGCDSDFEIENALRKAEKKIEECQEAYNG